MIRSIYFVGALALTSALRDECSIDDSSKTDCGVVGTTSDECEAKGCCWAESSTDGTPWCFYKEGAQTNCFGAQKNLKEPFSNSEVDTMRSYFLANVNIDNKGGVVAAPDQDTPGGSYYYHWMRDGALTMRSVLETSANMSDVEDSLKSYVQWVLLTGSESDTNGEDIRTEPKFNLPDGDLFTDPWCRPQNDGPGLQAITLIKFADQLMAQGDQEYVKKYLWTGDQAQYNGGAIKFHLDYVSDDNGYSSNTCDLWEEIRSSNFFWNRVTMKKAMHMGARFAQDMGDSSSSTKYSSVESTIAATLRDDHYDTNGKYIFEDVSRTKDSAVIVGLNSGYDEDIDGNSWLAPTSVEVAGTVSAYNTLFCTEYAVNNADTDGGITGVLYGRYGGDNYAGGNPWVLSTAALAQLLYRGASYILDNGLPSTDALDMWATALNLGKGASDLPSDPSAVATLFAASGDGVLLRLRKHVEADGFHLAEQIDRNTGKQISATDLTWSYAEVLNAMDKRAEFMTKVADKRVSKE